MRDAGARALLMILEISGEIAPRPTCHRDARIRSMDLAYRSHNAEARRDERSGARERRGMCLLQSARLSGSSCSLTAARFNDEQRAKPLVRRSRRADCSQSPLMKLRLPLSGAGVSRG